ncbi:hypothetical protein ES703_61179 [subsurface metagenome]
MNERLIYNILLATVFAAAAVMFIALYLISAPYGRHLRRGWGPAIQARAAWVIMEFPAVLIIPLCFIIGDRRTDIICLVFLFMWELHYVQRTFIFPFLMRAGNKRFPVLLVFLGIIFNLVNGYLNGRYLFAFSSPYPVSWITDSRFIIGLTLFLAGFAINLHSDHILRKLRKPGESGYRIPHGGLFKYVSNSNYLGEIMEWIGWTISTWSLALLLPSLLQQTSCPGHTQTISGICANFPIILPGEGS